MAIGNPSFGRFEEDGEKIYKSEEKEVTDPNAETEDDILDRIKREKEEKEREEKERQETPLAVADQEDVEDVQEIAEGEEEKDGISEIKDEGLPSKVGIKKSASIKDPDASLRRKPEPRFHRTKKIREDKKFKKGAA